jgi:ABC-type taurine transport system substrate-binding protein
MKKTLRGFTVYLDLDGVMANFDKAWYEDYGLTEEDWEYRQEEVAKMAPFFFLELEEMPGAVKLWKYLVKSEATVKVRRRFGSPNVSLLLRRSLFATGKKSRNTLLRWRF